MKLRALAYFFASPRPTFLQSEYQALISFIILEIIYLQQAPTPFSITLSQALYLFEKKIYLELPQTSTDTWDPLQGTAPSHPAVLFPCPISLCFFGKTENVNHMQRDRSDWASLVSNH